MKFVQLKCFVLALGGLSISLSGWASGGSAPAPEVIEPGVFQPYADEAQSRSFLQRFTAHDASMPIKDFQLNGTTCWMMLGSAPEAQPYMEQLRFLMQQSVWGQRLGKSVLSNLFVLINRGGLKLDGGDATLQLEPIALDSPQGLATIGDLQHFIDCSAPEVANFDGYTKVPLGGTVGKDSDPFVTMFVRAGDIEDLQEVFLTSIHEMHSFVDKKHVMSGYSMTEALQKGWSGLELQAASDADLELVFHTLRAFRLESHVYADLVRAGWFTPRDRWQHFIEKIAGEKGCHVVARDIIDALYPAGSSSRAKVLKLLDHVSNCTERAEPDLGASAGSIGSEQDQPKPHIKDW